MGSEPTGRVVVVMVTVPVGRIHRTGTHVTPPLVMVTVPVVPTGSVVVMVTGLPKELPPGVVTVTTGVALLTVCEREPVAELSFASPL